MRLWTVHPRYLDSPGLVALWREGLLAQAVLAGLTRGYRHHPQLLRFREESDSLMAIGSYLMAVHEESEVRGFQFERSKILHPGAATEIVEAEGQLLYEWEHLRRKLMRRNPERFDLFKALTAPEPHPLFRIAPGPVQNWERVS
ncbi:pyrimidine dimer DNA glycosylase/endonuclease V [Candidatus Neomarinimicrobiota bacterium]